MKRVVFRDLALRSNHFAGWAPAVRRVLFWLFVTQCMLVWARLWTPWSLLGDARWPEGLLLVLATASLIASLARHLPGQNVMLVAIIIAFIGGAAQSLGAATGVPFGPFVYTERFGQKLFSGLPWAVPLVWIAAIFVSRGVARLILRPWRRTSTYGFRLIGLTLLLVVLLDVGWEVFAVRVKQYWFWQPTKLAFDWYGTPVTNFLGWTVATLLILAFATPCLINKKPVAQPPPDYSPLAVWLLLSLLFATGAAVQQLWLAVGVISGISLVLTVFAVRGARW